MAAGKLKNHVIDIVLVAAIVATVGGCFWARAYYDSVFLEDQRRAEVLACGVIDDAIQAADRHTARITHGRWHGSTADSAWCVPYAN